MLGLGWHAWFGGWGGAASSLGGCVIAALPFVLLYVYAGGGAGDAKLMMAVGAWLGFVQGILVLLAVVLAGAALGLAQAAFARRLGEVTGRLGRLARVWLGWIALGRRPPKHDSTENTQPLQMSYAVSIFSGVAIAAIGTLLWNA